MGKIKKTKEREVVPEKAMKGKLEGKITKKEKQSAKRLTLFQQLEKLKKIREQERASLIKKPFSLKELSDMLPLIREEYDKRKKTQNTNVLPKAHQGFVQVCDHPQFKESPLATIREHLTNNFENSKNSTLQKKVEKSFRKNIEKKEANEMNVEGAVPTTTKSQSKPFAGNNNSHNNGGQRPRAGSVGRGGGNKAFNNKQSGGKGKK